MKGVPGFLYSSQFELRRDSGYLYIDDDGKLQQHVALYRPVEPAPLSRIREIIVDLLIQNPDALKSINVQRNIEKINQKIVKHNTNLHGDRCSWLLSKFGIGVIAQIPLESLISMRRASFDHRYAEMSPYRVEVTTYTNQDNAYQIAERFLHISTNFGDQFWLDVKGRIVSYGVVEIEYNLCNSFSVSVTNSKYEITLKGKNPDEDRPFRSRSTAIQLREGVNELFLNGKPFFTVTIVNKH